MYTHIGLHYWICHRRGSVYTSPARELAYQAAVDLQCRRGFERRLAGKYTNV